VLGASPLACSTMVWSVELSTVSAVTSALRGASVRLGAR